MERQAKGRYRAQQRRTHQGFFRKPGEAEIPERGRAEEIRGVWCDALRHRRPRGPRVAARGARRRRWARATLLAAPGRPVPAIPVTAARVLMSAPIRTGPGVPAADGSEVGDARGGPGRLAPCETRREDIAMKRTSLSLRVFIEQMCNKQALEASREPRTALRTPHASQEAKKQPRTLAGRLRVRPDDLRPWMHPRGAHRERPKARCRGHPRP